MKTLIAPPIQELLKELFLKKKLVITFILILNVFTIALVSAQPGGGGGFGDEPDDNAPIDGGTALLTIVASVYGAKRKINRNNKKWSYKFSLI